MKAPSRRTAIKILGASAAAASFPLKADAAQPDIDRPTLAAIAEVVLPSELGGSLRDEAVGAFVRWIRNYREGADTDHGYGFTRIRTTGPSPARLYPAQIAALDEAARARGAARFAAAPLAVRRTIVESAIAAAKIDRLPGRPNGGHVAADLMGHYFNSSAAADLCYRARIGRESCRGLPGSEKKPEPLR
jgi:hypothetical protein